MKHYNFLILFIFLVFNSPLCIAIIKGFKIDPKCARKYNYMVSLQEKQLKPFGNIKYIHLCGGTLINENWVLTAAHCVNDRDSVNLYIQIGTTISDSMEQFRRKVQKIELYRFNEYTMKNDIALIQIFPEYKNFTNYMKFANKTELKYFIKDQVTCSILGFGAIIYGGGYQNILYRANVKLITNEECVSILGRIMAPKPEDNTICAVGLEGEDACQGDSGGPLICFHEGNTFLYGIVSNGLSCGAQGVPSIYTIVGKYENWINNTIFNL